MSIERPPLHDRPPVLGLTGAVGAGKSTAARLFGELGCDVIDVDRMGHDALGIEDVRDRVLSEFGGGIADAGGGIDRRALASCVFGDAAALRRLEAIVHPAVRVLLDAALARAMGARSRGVIVDCALLFEGGLDALCDATIVVEAGELLRHRRITAARGWPAQETARREAAQWPAEEKRRRATRVLGNEGTEDDLRREVRALLDELAPADRSRAAPASGRS